MKTRPTIAVLLLAAVLIPSAFAQDASAPVAAEIGKDSAQQLLKEISVTKFEDASFWGSQMPLDMGLVTLRRLEGSPQGKKPIEDEKKLGIAEADRYVVGARINFFRRGPTYFTISPVAPIPIEGISKTLSVWVVGRNFNHMLKIVIEDFIGRRMELTLGKLNFVGWRQMTVAVPPTISQTEYHYTYKNGIKFLGFRIDCDPAENFGTYYLYLDDLRAVTDLFGESKRDTDDMVDSW